MNSPSFDNFFQGQAYEFLLKSINTALAEDGNDLTSRAVFTPSEGLKALLIAKENSIIAGLPLIPIILKEAEHWEAGSWRWTAQAQEAMRVDKGSVVAAIMGQTRLVLKAERVILNFISHMSGIANCTASYVKELAGTTTKLLYTRKTLPGLRYPEKYAVLAGGGLNHRFSLADMLMLKDNHIDAAGSITNAVRLLRQTYSPCPPIEVECRNLAEVEEAVQTGINRIMLDNMDLQTAEKALRLIPKTIETEISGGITCENIGKLARITPHGPDFISVGRLTHSAPAADFSIKLSRQE